MNQVQGQASSQGDFCSEFAAHDFAQVKEAIYAQTASDVERALNKDHRDLNDFMALLSPAAAPYLEEMAKLSRQLTQKRFGKTLSLYIPLYLSNVCASSCTYCGFRKENKQPRLTLTQKEVERELEVIQPWGYEHVLLVTGDMAKKPGLEYLLQALEWARPHFSQLSLEVQPMGQKAYESLIQKGLNGVMIYQETYGPRYREYHPRGSKADFFYRLQTPDRLGKAGIHRIGLGALLGLEDWRTDSWFVGLHLDYLKKTYWQTRYSVSFPRLRPAQGILEPKHPVNDKELVQIITAYRLLDENLDLSLSTRESPYFRDHAALLGVTNMSAGSRTEPGGYAAPKAELEQFAIHDDRSPREIVEMLKAQGLEAVFKDWDPHFGVP